MKSNDRTRNLIFAWAGLIAGVLQLIGLLRYVDRLPDDWIGIALYVITILAFAALSFFGFSQLYSARSS